jgi:hypothetical protein
MNLIHTLNLNAWYQKGKIAVASHDQRRWFDNVLVVHLANERKLQNTTTFRVRVLKNHHLEKFQKTIGISSNCCKRHWSCNLTPVTLFWQGWPSCTLTWQRLMIKGQIWQADYIFWVFLQYFMKPTCQILSLVFFLSLCKWASPVIPNLPTPIPPWPDPNLRPARSAATARPGHSNARRVALPGRACHRPPLAELAQAVVSSAKDGLRRARACPC